MKPVVAFRGMDAGSLDRLVASVFPSRQRRRNAAGKCRGRSERISADEIDVMGGVCVALFAALMLAFLV